METGTCCSSLYLFVLTLLFLFHFWGGQVSPVEYWARAAHTTVPLLCSHCSCFFALLVGQVSPVEYGHVLLIPRILGCSPQQDERGGAAAGAALCGRDEQPRIPDGLQQPRGLCDRQPPALPGTLSMTTP